MQLVSPVQLFDTSVKSTVASRRLCYIYICIILLIIIQALMTVCGDLNIKLSDILIEGSCADCTLNIEAVRRNLALRGTPSYNKRKLNSLTVCPPAVTHHYKH